MLYILAGAARSGKSTVADEVMEKFAISNFSIDFLIGALKEFERKFDVERGHKVGTPRQPIMYKSEQVWPATRGLIKTIHLHQRDYLLEGDLILPKQLDSIRKSCSFKAIFFGYPSITAEDKLSQLRTFKLGKPDWPSEYSDVELLHIIRDRLRFSRYLQDECAKYGFEFVDTSENFTAGIERAAKVIADDLKQH